jgi:hypothetical protein
MYKKIATDFSEARRYFYFIVILPFLPEISSAGFRICQHYQFIKPIPIVKGDMSGPRPSLKKEEK